MSDAKIDKTVINVESSNHTNVFQSEGEVVKFDGLKLYIESKDNEEENGKDYYQTYLLEKMFIKKQ